MRGVGVKLAVLAAIVSMPAPARPDAREADQVIAAARDAAQHDRNAESRDLFQRAISLDPTRRREWLRELADQMTFSGQAAEAVPAYREALAAGTLSTQDVRWARLGLGLALSWSHRLNEALAEYEALIAGDPRDLDARMRRAEVLSWLHRQDAEMKEYATVLSQDPGKIEARLRRAQICSDQDRLVAAKREYEAVLRQDPNNLEALRGVARVQSWRGKQRDAHRRLSQILAAHPDDAEATFLLAQSEAWMGRPDEATATLQQLFAQHPQSQNGNQLLSELQRGQRQATGVDYQSSEQSDRLVIVQQSFQHSLTLDEGRTTLGPRYQHDDFDPGRGQPAVVVQRSGAYGRHRFSDDSELTGNLFVDQIEPVGSGKSRTALTYDTYATFWPNDLLRFDVGSSRSTFDNVKSLTRGITGTYLNYSMDLVPDEKTRFTTRFNWGGYSDGNERLWGQIELERRVRTHPNLLFGARFTTIGFSKRLDNGYFNPGSYQSGVATAHMYGHRGNRFYYDFDGSYGREHANPGGGKPFSSAGARLTYRMSDRLEIEGHYSFFSSNQSSSGGFARNTTGISIRFGL